MTKWIEYGWARPANMFVDVYKVATFPAVTWPSGRITREACAGTAVLLPEESWSSRVLKAEQAKQAGERWVARTEATHLWIRRRRNGRLRARRFESIDWNVSD